MVRQDEVPADMREECEDKRQELIECVSNADDTLGDMFIGNYIVTNSSMLMPHIILKHNCVYLFRGESTN